ncbi:hypothetical protein MUY27_00095 [Mucilaginibacter sp. RS28]|uniref:Response regulator receiver domain-containing protein n=1 Tax=Mucilaginibacter straminoryzae TaxID=2932774 RepID=A0A9X1X414_9SPHI|nr:hypothetical protein [Mucilaginibacter straminoryzae]MCJ8208084.1 hypothetical protein [Mucilaginibacter straminoryzae]
MRATIAIIEPHPQIRPLFSELLNDLGYRVLFHTGRFSEFVLLVDPDAPPQVCINDTNYRDMYGFCHSKCIKENFIQSKTIIHSNDPSDMVYQAFKNIDVVDYYVDKCSGLEALQRAI